MKLEIANLTKYKIPKKFLKKIAGKTSEILKIKIPEISLVIVGEKKIKELNKKYRTTNRITDVLAFDYGEIFICFPQAKKQAENLNHSIKKELGILLIHGILHLIGYQDNSKETYNKMIKKQNQLWEKITL